MNKKRGNVPKTKGLITNDYLIIISIIVIAGIFFQTVKIFIIDNPNFPNNKANVIGLVTFEITKYPTNCINDAQDIIAWASPENACVSDDVYATASVKGSPLVKSDGLLVTGFHFAIPSGATINGIDVYAEVKVNVIGTAADYEIKLMKDGSTLIGDNLTNNPNREDIIKRMTETIRSRVAKMSAEERKEIWSRPMDKNPNWKGGVSICYCVDCNKEIWYGHVRCMDCSKKGEQNPFYGKHHSEKSKRKSSEKMKGKLPINTNPIILNGISYSSQTDASKKLGVSIGTISNWVNKKFKKNMDVKPLHPS